MVRHLIFVGLFFYDFILNSFINAILLIVVMKNMIEMVDSEISNKDEIDPKLSQ
jgi:hypothetical protein